MLDNLVWELPNDVSRRVVVADNNSVPVRALGTPAPHPLGASPDHLRVVSAVPPPACAAARDSGGVEQGALVESPFVHPQLHGLLRGEKAGAPRQILTVTALSPVLHGAPDGSQVVGPLLSSDGSWSTKGRRGQQSAGGEGVMQEVCAIFFCHEGECIQGEKRFVCSPLVFHAKAGDPTRCLAALWPCK